MPVLSTNRMVKFLALLCSAVFLFVVFIIPNSATAAATQQINYQGKLTNGSGVAVANGTYQMEFKLYNTLTGGSAVWTETWSGADEVTVTNGLFSIMLGSVTSLSSVDFGKSLYLSIKIGTDTEMSPRKTLGSVPSAMRLDGSASTTMMDVSGYLNIEKGNYLKYNGVSLLYSSTTLANYFIGEDVGNLTTTGGYNFGFGQGSMKNLTTGADNIAIGGWAFRANTTGSNNLAVGNSALDRNIGGSGNVALGSSALVANTEGDSNNAFGYFALSRNITADSNNAFGNLALQYNTIGAGNNAFGELSLASLSDGDYNIGFGYRTGEGNVNLPDQRSVLDDYMTFIGYQASRDGVVASTTAFSKSTAIGYNAKVGGSNMMALGGTGADAVSVGIGTTTPGGTFGEKLTVIGSTYTVGNATTTGYTSLATTTFSNSSMGTSLGVESFYNATIGSYPYLKIASNPGVGNFGQRALWLEDRLNLYGAERDPVFEMITTAEEFKITVSSTTHYTSFEKSSRYSFDNNVVVTGNVTANNLPYLASDNTFSATNNFATVTSGNLLVGSGHSVCGGNSGILIAGGNNQVLGDLLNGNCGNSAAIGNDLVVNGLNSFAIGTNNKATSGHHSFAGGQGTVSSGYGSFAYGEFATSSDWYSVVLGGISNEANGTSSYAFGERMKVNSNFSVGFGLGLGSEAYTIPAGRDGTFAIVNTQVKVGIGTSTPDFALVVGVSGATPANVAITNGALCVDDDGYCTPTTAGHILAEAFDIVANSDLAENYPVIDSSLEAGDVVAIVSQMSTSTESYGLVKAISSLTTLGIISTEPGVTLGFGNEQPNFDKQKPVALSGRVPVKVNMEGGEIKIGDYLTLSSEPGVATKATSSGMTVAIALESANQSGKVLAFVNLNHAHLSSAISQGSINADNFWRFDETTGQVTASGAINFGGFDLTNIKSISGIGNNWSISETGELIVKNIKAENAIIESGVTVKDRATGLYNCIYVENGAVKNKEGECQSNEASSSGGGSSTSSGSTETSSSTPPSSDTSSTTPVIEEPDPIEPAPETENPPIESTPTSELTPEPPPSEPTP